MHPLETYLRDLREARFGGVAETTHYPALRALLNAAGESLRPRVRCMVHPRSQGAGIPDAGLFTADQIGESDEDAGASLLAGGVLPARGVVEAKPTSHGVLQTAASAQVASYLERYGSVLVTNYWSFLPLQHEGGRPATRLESYQLARSEAEFWQAVAHPRALVAEHGDSLLDYLRRVLLLRAALRDPADVAWVLASYARRARRSLEKLDLEILDALRAAMERTLGVTFDERRGQHFFRSTVIQTLFYGLFSAWVLWARTHGPEERFDWRLAVHELRVPVVRALFEQVSAPSKVKPLQLAAILEWTGEALNRVNRGAFFESFDEGHAIQYFYEPFLEQFDPVLRKDLGVWYTPPEIVRTMVERVDRVLRDELGRADGLADPDVYVLDPCCGTGAYVLEVMRRIQVTLEDAGAGALLGAKLRRAVTSRIFGFEILPAPFVIAHMQVGILLQGLGTALDHEKDERAAIYLTNALTGWDPPAPASGQAATQIPFAFPDLEAEQRAAASVKRTRPILVVLGNPPYNAFAGVSSASEQDVGLYKEGLQETWGIKKFNLDDLYVRFFRLAERRVAEMTGCGVVCFISNHSYLSDPSFVVLRERLVRQFDRIWIDGLNGDSRETGKRTPDGDPDPSVFSTPTNREGIRLGTAIGLFVRRSTPDGQRHVRAREFWGAAKREELLASLDSGEPPYVDVSPAPANRWSLRRVETRAGYAAWPTVVSFAGTEPVSGLQERRRGALMDMEREALAKRMQAYFGSAAEWEALKAGGVGLAVKAGRYDPDASRIRVMSADRFQEANIRRYALYPLDVRWCYHSSVRPLWNEPRPTLAAQAWPGNRFFVARMVAERAREGAPLLVTPHLPDDHLLRPNVVAMPFRLREVVPDAPLLQRTLGLRAAPKETANLSAAARRFLASLGAPDPDTDLESSALLWFHALAIGHAPAWLEENAAGVRGDWPRVPVPESLGTLQASAALGQKVAALLDPDAPVPGVTTGSLDPALRGVGVLRCGSAGEPDLRVTAGWGHHGNGGVVMPGRGRVTTRPVSDAERDALALAADRRGVRADTVRAALGEDTLDVWLNEDTWLSNVPVRAWETFIGGYQVLKKWLSYREEPILGRAMTVDEADSLTQLARRLAALLLLSAELDANYRAIASRPGVWPPAV